MAVYQRRFSYNNRNNAEFGLRVVTFNPDDGEVDSFLSMESVYTDNYNGTMRHDYGAKYTETAKLYITMVKNNYCDFSRPELHEIVNWLTGLRKVSWLDLYNDDSREVSYSFLGRVTDIKLQKMDARIIGFKVEFTSVSPWAYSGIKKHDITLDGTTFRYPVCNGSDEDGVFVYPKLIFTNKAENGSLRIFNTTTREETVLQNLAMNEVVTMDANKIIYSDNIDKIFGEDFNFQWLRFTLGYNHINMTGKGHLTIEHRDIFKVGEAFDDNDLMNTDSAHRNVLLLTEVELLASNWVKDPVAEGEIQTYSQSLYIKNSTIYSKVDLQPTEDQLLEMQRMGIEIQVINNDGDIKAFSYRGAPAVDYVLQATIEETNKDITHRRGITTLYADAWYNQGDIYYQPIYIKGITKNSIVNLDLTNEQIELLEDNSATLFIKNNKGETFAYAVGYRPEHDFTVNLFITETTTNADKTIMLEDEMIYAEPLYF